VIFSGPKTVRVKRDLITMPSYERPELRLRRALNAIADAYDVVLLDTAPSVDVLQVAAVATATHVMVPLSLDQYAVKGAVQVIKLLGTLKRNRVFEGRLLGLIPTRWERVTTESRLQLEAMHAFGKKSKVPCYPPVPEDVRVKEAARAGQTLPEYDRDMRALRGVRMRSGKRVGGYVRIAMVLEEAL
jgi:chromosome partitioning protein